MLILVLMALAPALGCNARRAGTFSGSTETIFKMTDPAGDDNGPGTYKYPTGPAFEPGKKLFDLEEFQVKADRDNYYFFLRFAEIRDPMGSPGGFMELAHIYIADGSPRGLTETERAGANVSFDSKNPWHYLIKVMSWENSAVFYSEKGRNQEGVRGVKAEAVPGDNTIKVTVARKLLPGRAAGWKYYVLVGSQDGSGPDNFRRVSKQPGDWVFSGSQGSEYEPNVIDILAPEKGRHSQKSMLSSYDADAGKYAAIYPVTR